MIFATEYVSTILMMCERYIIIGVSKPKLKHGSFTINQTFASLCFGAVFQYVGKRRKKILS